MLVTQKSIAAALALMSVIYTCHSQLLPLVPTAIVPPPSGAQIALNQISTGTERFTFELFKRLSEQAGELDFILSPFSVWSLLILTAEGAAGNTYAQLQQVLGLPIDLTYIRESYSLLQKSFQVSTPTIELALNQVLFTDRNRPIELELEDKLQRVYDADHVSVDFSNNVDAYYMINDYVMEKTHNRLGRVVSLDDLKDAQMLLISAIYFKGQWTFPFNRSDTRRELFYDENGVSLGEVDMMYQLGPFAYTSIPSLNAHLVELPYGVEHRLSMVLILPKKGESLNNVIGRLSQTGLANILAQLAKARADFEDDEVEVFLPRLKTRADFVLNQVMQSMGLVDIFEPNAANLSKISKQAYLSRIIHKAEIEINEEGTVASAATAGSFANKNSPPRFYANRPFAYLIVEKNTNIVLFCGQVKNPASGKH